MTNQTSKTSKFCKAIGGCVIGVSALAFVIGLLMLAEYMRYSALS